MPAVCKHMLCLGEKKNMKQLLFAFNDLHRAPLSLRTPFNFTALMVHPFSAPRPLTSWQPKTVHMSNAELLTLSSGPDLTVWSQNESQFEMWSVHQKTNTQDWKVTWWNICSFSILFCSFMNVKCTKNTDTLPPPFHPSSYLWQRCFFWKQMVEVLTVGGKKEEHNLIVYSGVYDRVRVLVCRRRVCF